MEPACLVLPGLDTGEGCPSLGCTITRHEKERAMARYRWQNIAVHFTLCKVQHVRVYSGIQAHRRAQHTTIHKCTAQFFENRTQIAQKSQHCSQLNVQTSQTSQKCCKINVQRLKRPYVEPVEP